MNLKERICSIKTCYEANKEDLLKIEAAIKKNGTTNDGCSEATESFEQGFNNGIELVCKELQIDLASGRMNYNAKKDICEEFLHTMVLSDVMSFYKRPDIAGKVATYLISDNKYDCNESYWTNINSAIEKLEEVGVNKQTIVGEVEI